MHPLEGQVAIVTGASRGLGWAVARAFEAAGLKVAGCARTREGLAHLASVSEVFVRPVDVTDLPAVEAFVAEVEQRLGPVAVLVNNAGVGWHKPFLEHSPEELRACLDVNVLGSMWFSRTVLPGMLEREAGHIINVASDLARKPMANMAAYVAAKHAVLGFSHSLLREVKNRGVKVSTFLPGIMDTFFGGTTPGREETWAMPPEHAAELLLGVLATPRHLILDEIVAHPMQQEF